MALMRLNKEIICLPQFKFDYFLKEENISCICPKCSSTIELRIRIYRSGKMIEKLEQGLIDDLFKNQVIKV